MFSIMEPSKLCRPDGTSVVETLPGEWTVHDMRLVFEETLETAFDLAVLDKVIQNVYNLLKPTRKIELTESELVASAIEVLACYRLWSGEREGDVFFHADYLRREWFDLDPLVFDKYGNSVLRPRYFSPVDYMRQFLRRFNKEVPYVDGRTTYGRSTLFEATEEVKSRSDFKHVIKVKLKPLGRGVSGVVKLEKSREYGTIAVKTPKNKENIRNIRLECSIYLDLGYHVGICHFFNSRFTSKYGIEILLEVLTPMTKVLDTMTIDKGCVVIKQVQISLISIFHDIAVGLAWMHDCGWVHRDIKLGNMGISEKGRGCLFDFGHAVQLESCESSSALTTSGDTDPLSARIGLGLHTDVYFFGKVFEKVLKKWTLEMDSVEEAFFNTVVHGCVVQNFDKRWTMSKVVETLNKKYGSRSDLFQKFTIGAPYPSVSADEALEFSAKLYTTKPTSSGNILTVLSLNMKKLSISTFDKLKNLVVEVTNPHSIVVDLVILTEVFCTEESVGILESWTNRKFGNGWSCKLCELTNTSTERVLFVFNSRIEFQKVVNVRDFRQNLARVPAVAKFTIGQTRLFIAVAHLVPTAKDATGEIPLLANAIAGLISKINMPSHSHLLLAGDFNIKSNDESFNNLLASGGCYTVPAGVDTDQKGREQFDNIWTWHRQHCLSSSVVDFRGKLATDHRGVVLSISYAPSKRQDNTENVGHVDM